ncbi:MAG TPA: hypothetical protein VN227_01530, partial [Methanoregula sp.]|nr:hypothetical protein [Methanoregula sp.]
KGDENSGVQIEVIGPSDDVVFGPRFINTDYQGNFAIDVPITEPGDYEVSFTDARGYVGKRIITVTSQQYQTLGASPTSTTVSIVSAHAKSSRDNPVYFAIKTGNGKVNIHTSSSIDWVMEYVDDKGTINIVNDEGEQYPEKVQVQGRGKTVYVKVYPKNSVNSEVFLYAENAVSIVVSPTVPVPFAASVSQTPTDTPTSPPLLLLGVISLGIAFLIVKRYKRRE